MNRNVFPASYLKPKQNNLALLQSKRSSGCGRSLSDLTRRQSLFVKRANVFTQNKIGIRRPRSKRREDWHLAMTSLVPQNGQRPRIFCETPSPLSHCPMLPSCLLQHDYISFVTSISLRPLLRPRQGIIIANLKS